MKRVLKELLNTGIYFLVLLGLTYLLVTFVVQRTQVNGSSMEPMLHDSDNLFVDKISYRFQDPERFDIIVFPPVSDPNKFYIKRIIGLPGETIRIDEEGRIYVDGKVLEESYGKEVIQADHIGRAVEEVILEKGEYFVLGDNRNNSIDSRDGLRVGNVQREDIIGKAWVRIWPIKDFGVLQHQ